MQQQSVEFDDIVRLLSPSLSLAELYGDRRTADALRILQRTIGEAGMVFHAPVSVQEVWASLGEKEKNSIRMGFDAARWEILVPFPLKHGAKSRVGRLRGYGNAINLAAAQTFIETVLEFIQEDEEL